MFETFVNKLKIAHIIYDIGYVVFVLFHAMGFQILQCLNKFDKAWSSRDFPQMTMTLFSILIHIW